ncbi:MAG: fasciclin domain-containing protein, partial [Bacteroidales bacterium]|nr:fasciclin domain-containing protein [Bacteroidales bacterium]
KAMSGDLSNNQEIATLLGKNVKVTINGEGVFINNAKVTVADIEADNGVVHVIDAVMLPPVETSLFERSDEIEKMGIYPNPASEYMVLSVSDAGTGYLKVINANGAEMINRYLDNLASPVDISMLENGFYFIMLQTPKGNFTGKLLVK